MSYLIIAPEIAERPVDLPKGRWTHRGMLRGKVCFLPLGRHMRVSSAAAFATRHMLIADSLVQSLP